MFLPRYQVQSAGFTQLKSVIGVSLTQQKSIEGESTAKVKRVCWPVYGRVLPLNMPRFTG